MKPAKSIDSRVSTPDPGEVRSRSWPSLLELVGWGLVSIATTGYLYLTGLFGVFSTIYVGAIILGLGLVVFRLGRVFRHAAHLGLLILFLASTGFGFVDAGASEYSKSKLTGLAIAAILMVLPSAVSRPRLAALFALSTGAALSWLMLLKMLTLGETLPDGRITLSTLNSIHSGRAIGMAVVVLSVFILVARVRLRYRMLMIIPWLISVYGLIAAGSRGPALAAASAAVLTLLLLMIKQRRSRAWIIVVCLFGLIVISTLLDPNSRVLSADDNGRDGIYDAALNYLVNNPVGIGWGNFEMVPGASTQWPHNIFLEIGVEGGWVSLVFFVIFVVVCLWGSLRVAIELPGVIGILSCVYLFYTFIAAQFSADISGNNILWGAIGLSLAVQGSAKLGGRWTPRQPAVAKNVGGVARRTEL